MGKVYRLRGSIKVLAFVAYFVLYLSMLYITGFQDSLIYLYIILAFFIIYMLLAAFLFKVKVNERLIKTETIWILPSVELEWEEIEKTADASWLGFHVYYFIPRDKSSSKLVISNWLEDYKDILAEAVMRLPQSKIEDSIKELAIKE